ncbi:Prenyltransferase [Candidatus Nitrosocosmicus franklandus]|uniref:Prenyltransferase n=1 Tax=Candidatus Nitrosocosmicus franklandianus TaxID=1798806 RepID=A0A484I3Z1_9ARCH|nr:Prenyltransferase [Candidatus Nitrosocosmicus franklandus]
MLLDNPYLKLLRIPNIFTVPSDIILGFLIAHFAFQGAVIFGTSESNLEELVILIFSSISLYLGGLVSNDLFDIKTDKIERPTRPLSSGRVQERHAIFLMIALFCAGFFLSFFVNIIAVGISGTLVLSILVYNYKLKSGFFRPFLMGGIRALNVFYGFSILFGFSSQTPNNVTFPPSFNPAYLEPTILLLLLLALGSVFFHVFVLTWISSKETRREFDDKQVKVASVKNVYYTYIIFLVIVGFFGSFLVVHLQEYLIFIVAIAIVVTFIYHKAQTLQRHLQGSLIMQFIVKNMLLLLILLDSAFIAGLSGPIAGISTALLILPSIYLSKRISMT